MSAFLAPRSRTRIAVPSIDETPDALALVERGEECLRALGFRVFRVRYVAGPPVAAKVQIAPDEMPALATREPAIREQLAAAGFSAVEIDPAGYR